MKNKERLCIYGGTFSPPHLGHYRAVGLLMEQLRPDRLLVIPDCLPPHKEPDGGATDEDRLHMCRLCFGEIPGVEISDMELARGGRSYTVDTLRALAGEDRELYMLCGTDMFLSLPHWREPREIFSLCTPCYVRRENQSENDVLLAQKVQEYRVTYGRDCIAVCGAVTEVCSTMLRQALRAGAESARTYLHPAVYDYIKQRGIYRT